MTRILILAAFTASALANDAWDSRRLLSDFHAEGATIGDLDGDGKNDLAYGPFWWAGPDFTKQRRFAEGRKFSPRGYSDNFRAAAIREAWISTRTATGLSPPA